LKFEIEIFEIFAQIHDKLPKQNWWNKAQQDPTHSHGAHTRLYEAGIRRSLSPPIRAPNFATSACGGGAPVITCSLANDMKVAS